MICNKCGVSVPVNKFCQECGSILIAKPAVEKRRLAKSDWILVSLILLSAVPVLFFLIGAPEFLWIVPYQTAYDFVGLCILFDFFASIIFFARRRVPNQKRLKVKSRVIMREM